MSIIRRIFTIDGESALVELGTPRTATIQATQKAVNKWLVAPSENLKQTLTADYHPVFGPKPLHRHFSETCLDVVVERKST